MSSVAARPRPPTRHASGPPEAATSHADARDLQPGDVLAGRWLVERMIGRGGMGVVVAARHAETGQLVALKVLHDRHRDNVEAVSRFTLEGRATARIRGEHCARLFDMGTWNGLPFLVMELLAGRDLAARIAEGPVPLEEAALYIQEACLGIAEVHAHGIVHRDLKPSNLFLADQPDGRRVIKVLDFGIAKGVAVDDPLSAVQTQTLVAMGTPLYMSPEQIRSSRTVDARADVWSLGTIFYELVSGRPAFGGNTVTHITAQVLERDPQPLTSFVPGLPPEVDAVVALALRKDPNERLIDVAALAERLEPFAGPRGAGAGARCARILAGALRPELGTHAPVVRDDPAGGTIRFKRSRITRGVIAVAAMAVLALGLTGLALDAWVRAPQPSAEAGGRSLAKRGLSRRFGELALSAAAAPEVAPTASAARMETSIPAPTLAGPPPRVAPLGPTGPRPTASTRPPAAPRATGDGAFNPFSDRN